MNNNVLEHRIKKILKLLQHFKKQQIMFLWIIQKDLKENKKLSNIFVS